MQFLSLGFILVWIVALVLYYLVPVLVKSKNNKQWIVLLIVSIAFYLYAIKAVPIGMLATGISTYLCGLFLQKSLNKEKSHVASLSDKDEKKKIKNEYLKKRKGVQVVYFILNLGLLVCFKYTSLIMPLGISFYTLVAFGYIVDAGRENCEVETNPGKLFCFLFYFPGVTQGPFTRAKEMLTQFEEEHKYDIDVIIRGAIRFLWGAFKKLVIADRIGIFVDNVYGSDLNEISGSFLALATVLYVLQLYSDFSGYIDMAMGISESFGISLPENFKRPLFAKNVAEFWRRWHISLGNWFKDYVMYSFVMSSVGRKIGKKAKSLSKNNGRLLVPVLGTMLVWILTGAWHGKTVTYMLWGVYYGVIMSISLILEGTFKKWKEALHIKDGRLYSAFSVFRTWIIVFVADALIRCNTLTEAKSVFCAMLFRFNIRVLVSSSLTDFGLSKYDFMKLFAALFIFFVVSVMQEKKIDVRDYLKSRPLPIRWGCYYILILMILVFGIYGGGFDTSAFMYQSF